MVREDVNAILFDEPLTVIDPHMKWELRTQLKQLHREFGHTMIYVTHDQTEALTFADKVVVMYDGRVVQMGTPEELFETPAHTFVGYFIGSPGMNLLEAEIRGNTAMVAGQPVALGAGYGPVTGRSQIGIRPEYAVLTAGDGLPITIRRVEDVGRHRIIRGEVDGNTVNVIASEGMAVDANLTHVRFQPERINVYADDWRVAPVGTVGGAA
jgi:glycerol transport system ATP-binding protein